LLTSNDSWHFASKEEDEASLEHFEGFGVTLGSSGQPGQEVTQATVMAFNGLGGLLALEMGSIGKDHRVGVVVVGAVEDVGGFWKLLHKTPGCLGVTTAQRPSADSPGSTIKSPPDPAKVFFLET